jgi:hypothetical protein
VSRKHKVLPTARLLARCDNDYGVLLRCSRWKGRKHFGAARVSRSDGQHAWFRQKFENGLYLFFQRLAEQDALFK